MEPEIILVFFILGGILGYCIAEADNYDDFE